jgi:glycosyltransferase involved in cell wall biosynthesis
MQNQNSNKKKLLSLITVCLNSEKTIERTLKSVQQELEATDAWDVVEYLVVDGKSLDGTLEIIKANMKAVSKFISEPDNGIFSGMNKGWRLASGEFVMFLNSDDYIVPGALKSIIATARFAKKQKYEICTGNTALFSENDKKIVNQLGLINFGLRILSRHNPIAHPSTLVSLDLIKAFDGFNESIKISSDYDFFVRVLKNENFKVLASNRQWVLMQTNGASNQYQSRHAFFEIERELFFIQLTHFGLRSAITSIIFRFISHFKYFICNLLNVF